MTQPIDPAWSTQETGQWIPLGYTSEGFSWSEYTDDPLHDGCPHCGTDTEDDDEPTVE